MSDSITPHPPGPPNDEALAVPSGVVSDASDTAQPKRGLSSKKLNAYIDERLGERAKIAAKRVREVVRRTRLWRKEKFDVACELIDHFKEAMEHGVEVDDAVRDFGDTREAAKMIRRSKVRCRSWYWKGCRRCLKRNVRRFARCLLIIRI